LLKLYLDIEVRAPRLIMPTEATEPIACCSVLRNDKPNQIRTYLLTNEERQLVYKIRVRLKDGEERIFRITVLPCPTERRLLQLVAQEIHDSDCVLGWNVRGYDLPYIIHRMEKNNLNPSIMSPLDRVYFKADGEEGSKYKGEVVIEGVNVLDLQEIYTEVKARSLYTSLERASEETLGLKKFGECSRVHEMSNRELVIYNAGDVILTYLLDEALKLSDFAIELSRESYRPIRESYAKSQIVDSTLLAFARKYGVVLPTRRAYKHERYKGAIVLEPIVGLHEDVLVCDFKRMYPTIIINFNLSPETVVEPTTPVRKLVFTLEDGRRVGIRIDKKGLVPAYLEDLFKLRDRYDEMLKRIDPHDPMYEVYKQKRQIVKDTINSVYGQFSYAGSESSGSKGSRIYCPVLAELTSYLARKLLGTTIYLANKLGFKLIYGDTDSIFVICGGRRDYERIAEELTKALQDELEREYGKKFNIVLEPKEHFKRLLLYRKKRYAGLVDWKEGEVIDPPVLEVKGFELVRTDTPKLTKDMQERLFRLLLEFGYDEVLINAFIRRYWEMHIKAKLEDIAVPVVVHKLEYKVNNVQAKAIRFAKSIGIDVYPGKRLFWLYTKDGNVIAVDEEHLDLLEQFRDRVDFKRMFERNVLNKISGILEVFRKGGKVSVSESVQTQTTLDRFFS